MSHFKALMERLHTAAKYVGVAELAKRSKVEERTIQRLLKRLPIQLENLQKLDNAAAEIVGEIATEVTKTTEPSA